MLKTIGTLGVGWSLGLCALLGLISAAEAITYESAAVQYGVAVVEGKATQGATIYWEGNPVTQANSNNGGFVVFGVVPADCVGHLAEGSSDDPILVELDDCVPVSAGAPVPVEVTGQTTCYNSSFEEISCAGTAQDGDMPAGVPFPNPRFTDNLNGTVTDNLTGLIWLKNANCFDSQTWEDALTAVSQLNDGTQNCGDTSNAGIHQIDWRLPNVKELQSLIHFGFFRPALSNALGDARCTATDCAFSGVQSFAEYWSSTTDADDPEFAWVVRLGGGRTDEDLKDNNANLVWPVRGGE